MFTGSRIKMADITDGVSNTYLCGEKWINPDNYSDGNDYGDNEFAFMGENEDIVRWAVNDVNYAPRQDRSGGALRGLFGSAHATGFHMAFCDGSVQYMNYSIVLLIHSYLGNRRDGKVIKPGSY
jgi:prepilin-type processing-associated H-X9-DG protein